MGIQLDPCKLFTLLHQSEEGVTEEARRATAHLRSFALYAFILHDTKEHSLLDEHLSLNWERLDDDSGDKLLWSSYATPSNSWKGTAKRRPLQSFYNHLQRGANRRLGADSMFGVTSAKYLATRLGVSHETLPAIVICTNLEQNGYSVLGTNSRNLDNQLWALKKLAHEAPCPQDLQRQLKELASKEKVHLSHHEGPISRPLAQALSFENLITSDRASRQNQQKKCMSWVRDEMRPIINPPTGQEIQQHDLARGDELYAFSLTSQIKRSSRVGPSRLASARGFDLDSQGTISDTNRSLDACDSLSDPSFAARQIGIIYEREINRSIVQYLRKQKGIPMPGCYRKLAPDIGTCLVKTGSGNLVPLNAPMKDKESWQSLEIGRAYFAGLACLPTKDKSSLRAWPALKDHWERISKIRNKGSHDNPFTTADLETAIHAHNQLVDDQSYQKMFTLKNEMKSKVARMRHISQPHD